jgi:LDH2 family malate/lactate/ureidoglycolate dehydrogenase
VSTSTILPTQGTGAEGDMPRVDAEALERFGVACFTAMGLTADDARVCADALMQSELRYHPGQGQGIKRLLSYRERIDAGRVDIHAPFEVLKESPAWRSSTPTTASAR